MDVGYEREVEEINGFGGEESGEGLLEGNGDGGGRERLGGGGEPGCW